MGNIKSEASQSELNSPFYHENLAICNEWEKFIISNNGTIKGKVTAWALIIKAKFSNKVNWQFKIEKATMTNGSLFHSSKKNKYLKTEINAKQIKLPQSFKIVRRSLINRVKAIYNQSFQNINDKYVITFKNKNEALKNNSIINIFKNTKDFYNLEKIEYDKTNGVLKLSFNSIVMDFKLIKNLVRTE